MALSISASTVLLALMIWSSSVDSYKILMIPIPSKGHLFPVLEVASGLVSRGNDVTMLLPRNFSGIRGAVSREQSRLVVEEYQDGGIFDKMEEEMFGNVLEQGLRWRELLSTLKERCRALSQHILNDNEILFDKLDASGFDIAIVDGIAAFRFFYLIPHRLRIPVITYSDDPPSTLIRVPWLASFVPHLLTPFRDRMNLVERLQNVALSALMLFSSFTDLIPEVTLNRYRQYGAFGNLDELGARSVLWLYPLDPILGYARPTMPNLIPVGGLSVQRSTGELSADLKHFVESSKRGSIIVSFGSIVSGYPLALTRKFIEAFRQLNGVHIVWRWRLVEKDDGSQLEFPPNVRTLEWIPQNDLLASSSVKLFITHCGKNGQYEALYHAVPMIGFPLFADQKHNAVRMASKGFGIEMDILSFTADELLSNIRKVLDGGMFKNSITKASAIFRSSPMTPVETASFWIEHVCRFGGDHLQSGGNDLPIYAYYMMDVAAVVAIFVCVTLFIGFILLDLLRRKLCQSRLSIKSKIN